jgi:hypothetical protein
MQLVIVAQNGPDGEAGNGGPVVRAEHGEGPRPLRIGARMNSGGGIPADAGGMLGSSLLCHRPDRPDLNADHAEAGGGHGGGSPGRWGCPAECTAAVNEDDGPSTIDRSSSAGAKP